MEYGDTEVVPTHALKHRFVRATVHNLPGWGEGEPVVALSRGKLGVQRIIHLRPQPVDDCFRVAWNGDTRDPQLRFDLAPDVAEIIIEVLGK